MIIVTGEDCPEKWLLAKKLIKSKRYILKDRSGLEMDSIIEYYNSDQLFAGNVNAGDFGNENE